MATTGAKLRSAVKDELQRRLYEAFFAGQDRLLVREIQREYGWDDRVFWRALEDLSAEHLANGLDSGPNYEITPEGIVAWEARGLAPPALRDSSNKARVAILQKYAAAYEEKGREGDLHGGQVVKEVVADAGLDETLVMANHDFLYNSGNLEHPGSMGFFRIAEVAVEPLRDWSRRTARKERFDALAALDQPAERGRQFEELFAEVAEAAGWTVDPNVRGPGEEIDLVLSRDVTFHLLECRWWSDSVGTKEIRDFAGKLRKRAATVGIVVSMSGFTTDATAEVEGTTGETPIVLFGPQDVTDLFEGRKQLDEMLAEKRRSLIHRRARWS
jgi:hypothetical protein